MSDELQYMNLFSPTTDKLWRYSSLEAKKRKAKEESRQRSLDLPHLPLKVDINKEYSPPVKNNKGRYDDPTSKKSDKWLLKG